MANSTAAAVGLQTPSSGDDSALHTLYEELVTPGCPDRGAKLQVFCERVWNRLDANPPPTDLLVETLTILLENDDNLLLAQLVVPDLRSAAALPRTPQRQIILQRIQSRQPLLQPFNQKPQISNAEANHHFEEEKRVLQDAEVYRASILLAGNGHKSETQKQKIRQWLLEFPKDDI